MIHITEGICGTSAGEIEFHSIRVRHPPQIGRLPLHQYDKCAPQFLIVSMRESDVICTFDINNTFIIISCLPWQRNDNQMTAPL
jgi:hypothetical protein